MHTVVRTVYDAMQQNAQFSKSKVPCLLRHRGGKYYASAKVSGKIIRRSLETDDFNTAKNRLAPALAEMRGATNSTEADTLGNSIRDEAAKEVVGLKPSTRKYYRQVALSLNQVGAGMAAGTLKTSDPKKKVEDPLVKSIAKVKLGGLKALMNAYAGEYGATRHNGALALIRRTYSSAIEAGHVASNVPEVLKRMQPVSKEHDLPTSEDFARIIANILAQQKTYSKASAASVEFLAYTGLRISEAQKLRWGQVKDKVLVTRTAKNQILRQVPLIPAALELLDRLRAAGVPHGPGDPILLTKSPRIALEGACKRLGIDHMRVHDLRHIFATRCIESGTPLPTIAEWLGHKDRGVLCAQVYGHLCKKHSNEMAANVKV